RGCGFAERKAASGHTIYPNGVVATFVPDALNRLKSIEHFRPKPAPAPNETIAKFTYTLDNVGNRRAVKEEGEIGLRDVVWGYDDEYKLTSEVADGPNPLNVGFVYDNVGNRLTRTDGLATTQFFEYDANDRISKLNGLQFLYDANGNTLADEGNSYTWDIENRMLSAAGGGHSLGNSYDGDGMRLASVADGAATQYVMDPNTAYYRVLEERAAGGALNVSYTYGDALLKQSQGPTFYHGDAIGSTRTLTDLAQTMTTTYAYEGFGSLLATAGTPPNKYLFAGELLEESVGLYNNRARWMNPRLGRFLGMDPLEGIPKAPRSLNRFVYVLDEPVQATDPGGAWPPGIHSALLDAAFVGNNTYGFDYARDRIKLLKAVSAEQDDPWEGGQDTSRSYQHAMYDGDSPQTPQQGKTLYENFIRDEKEFAIQVVKLGKGPQNFDLAMDALGRGMHALMDSTSPAHRDDTGTPLPWYGLSDVPDLLVHISRESNITQYQVDVTVALLRNYYIQWYGAWGGPCGNPPAPRVAPCFGGTTLGNTGLGPFLVPEIAFP
ncbi:MAG: RHS repeat-associated core domain-containing protein, partial [Planctomycetes bacterium]|nr:RHS repeat-associated core domain-containing protein [Planctomycetota bacterium]